MKKAKNTTKLLAAISALVVAVAVSAGSTFAWFTANSSVSVSGINASVKSADGSNIMIAVGHQTSSSNFKYALTSDDLASYADTTLEALTNNNGDSSNVPSFRTLTGNNGTNAYTYSDTNATTGFLKIELTLKVEEASTTIYLSEESEVTTETEIALPVKADTTAWATNSYNTVTLTDGDPITAYACNATRVGFNTRESASGNEETNFKVWSPNEALVTGGESTGTNSRSISSTTNYWKNNLARDYYNYINGTSIATTQVAYANNYIDPTTSSHNEVVTPSIEVDGSYYAFIYIYVWIEGTDGDCFNNILEQSINVDLSFTLEDPAA